MAVFQPKRREIPQPKIGGGSSGISQLLAYQLGQEKSKQQQAQMPENSVITSATDPYSGLKRETPESVSKRKFGKEDIQVMGASDDFTKSRDYIIGEIDKDPSGFAEAFKKANVSIPGLTFGKQSRGNILGFPTTYGSEKAINIQRSLDNMSDLLLRLRSGAQINEQEFDRLRSLMPTYKDISVPLGEDGVTTYPTIRTSLNNFEDSLSKAKQRAIEGGFFNEEAWTNQKTPTSPVPNMPGYQASGQSRSTNKDESLMEEEVVKRLLGA